MNKMYDKIVHFWKIRYRDGGRRSVLYILEWLNDPHNRTKKDTGYWDKSHVIAIWRCIVIADPIGYAAPPIKIKLQL